MLERASYLILLNSAVNLLSGQGNASPLPGTSVAQLLGDSFAVWVCWVSSWVGDVVQYGSVWELLCAGCCLVLVC